MNETVSHDERSCWATKSPVAFGVTMIVLMYAIKIIALPLILLLGGGSTTAPVVRRGFLMALFSFAILPIETLVGQALPIWFLRKFDFRQWGGLCLLSAIFFGLLHAPIGGAAFVVGFTSGLVLSYCWLSWSQDSFKMAFVSTTLVHAGHNAVAFIFFVAGGG